MRVVYGASAVAAASVIAVGLFQPATAPAATDQVDPLAVQSGSGQGAAVSNSGAPDVVVRHVIKYVHLKPGQTAPPGATVITPNAPAPRVVVTHNAPANAACGAQATCRASTRAAAGSARTHAHFRPPMNAPLPPDGPSTRFVGWSTPAMGGTLNVAVFADEDQVPAAQRSVRLTGQRVRAWAKRLTRFEGSSDLSRLNAGAASLADGAAELRPTLAAVLSWAALAAERSRRVVDVTMLDARLAAESGSWTAPVDLAAWSLEPRGRQTLIVRPAGVRFDLDGVAKGWLADRAADLLDSYRGVAVDADGDISLRAGPGIVWQIEVVDPRGDDRPPLATMQFIGGEAWSRAAGVATSATTVHRWLTADGGVTHHLIDPRTRRSAATDVIQATVVAPTAREAEMLAKTALILGSDAALPLLAASVAQAAILLLDTGELLALPGTEAWLA